MSKFILPKTSEWTFELLERTAAEIGRIAKDFQLDTYPNQLEIITSEQMIDAYTSIGMPTSYNHWSFGKSFMATSQEYERGQMGLAYEIVINSSPCVAYLMEENTLTMQALVIAHASFGHNSFFKGNYLFKQWTDAENIVDYTVYAKEYIAACEKKHGIDAVEKVLDSCHALQNYGVDRYKRPTRVSAKEEKARQAERAEYAQTQINDLWRTVPTEKSKSKLTAKGRFPKEPQENILQFIEENAPHLEPWKREIIRIVRHLAQYFYPQRQTQVMNEGWATFWHYTLLNQMYEEDIVGDGFMLEFLQSHAGVTNQRDYQSINPYALGFGMMTDIRRMCESPTDEDRKWFPNIAGRPWLETLDEAMRNFKDESFIQQYLSPRVIRHFHLFSMMDDDSKSDMGVTAIHDDDGYEHIRRGLSAQYNLSNNEPNIQVYSVDVKGDRTLTLRHVPHLRRPLNKYLEKSLKHAANLWGYDVKLDTVSPDGAILESITVSKGK